MHFNSCTKWNGMGFARLSWVRDVAVKMAGACWRLRGGLRCITCITEYGLCMHVSRVCTRVYVRNSSGGKKFLLCSITKGVGEGPGLGIGGQVLEARSRPGLKMHNLHNGMWLMHACKSCLHKGLCAKLERRENTAAMQHSQRLAVCYSG